MAYDVEVIQWGDLGRERGGSTHLMGKGAPLVFSNVVAAGKVALNSGTRFVEVRNRAGSQAIYAKLQAVTGATNAAAGNAPQLNVSDRRWYAVPHGGGALAGGAEIDIR